MVVLVVTAGDFTHDPANGVDIGAWFEELRQSRDDRIKYLIFNRKVSGPNHKNALGLWVWNNYSGDNPHTHHGHLSVVGDPQKFDNMRPWPGIGVFKMNADQERTLIDNVDYLRRTTQWEIRPWVAGIYPKLDELIAGYKLIQARLFNVETKLDAILEFAKKSPVIEFDAADLQALKDGLREEVEEQFEKLEDIIGTDNAEAIRQATAQALVEWERQQAQDLLNDTAPTA